MGPASQIALAAAAAFAAGIVNALAGGGTLITFPTLTALGVPALTANTTNTIALVPGYFGGSFAQRGDLSGQRRRFQLLTATGALGGLAGGLLLLWSGERMFRRLTPWLLLFASLLLAAQGWIRRRVLERRRNGAPRKSEAWVALPVFFAAIYGGYFGGALGVVVLAVLAVMLDDPLPKLNAMKQSISFAVNGTAALLFAFKAPVDWPIAGAMAVGALLGGTAGGRLASKVKPEVLRAVAVVAGLTAAGFYFVKLRG
jgi:uncharacterized membrane protein YfcA